MYQPLSPVHTHALGHTHPLAISTPLLVTPGSYHWRHTCPPRGQTDTCVNIKSTFLQLRLQLVINTAFEKHDTCIFPQDFILIHDINLAIMLISCSPYERTVQFHCIFHHEHSSYRPRGQGQQCGRVYRFRAGGSLR